MKLLDPTLTYTDKPYLMPFIPAPFDPDFTIEPRLPSSVTPIIDFENILERDSEKSIAETSKYAIFSKENSEEELFGKPIVSEINKNEPMFSYDETSKHSKKKNSRLLIY